MGEPLPKGVGAQWRRWCNGQGYAKTDFGIQIHQHYYDQLSQPALWISATDDKIAPPANVDDLLSVYQHLDVHRRIIDPTKHSLNHLGHMHYFTKHSQHLWTEIVNWIVARSKI